MARAAILLAALALGGSSAPQPTFATAGTAATSTLLNVFYAGNGLWRECDLTSCPEANTDWGVDSLTYTLWLRWSTAHDDSVVPAMNALIATAPTYPAPCTSDCSSWSDVPEWDAIADVRMYQVTADAGVLAKAESAYAFVDGSNAYELGACPDIPYQQPQGETNQLKTLETAANAVKAAILLYEATGGQSYLDDAETMYAAIRAHFLDPKLWLYTVYVFDNGTSCTQVPRRFFASVNGDMIWNGAELFRTTRQQRYLSDALATGRAVAGDLADPAGFFADLQAENDVVEPLVEGMDDLATGIDGQSAPAFAASWIVRNAATAVNARASDGSLGRFFDGPASPNTTVTAWQANGGLALEIAAAALDPRGAAAANPWAKAVRITRSIGFGDAVRIRASAVAFFGTLGAVCCEPGHARVLVDGKELVDETGIWQNKSSLGQSIPNTLLFAWRWPRPGTHTIRFEPGVENGKEGGPFLRISSYLVAS